MIGWEFAVSSTIAIGGLGFWDEAGDGLLVSHEVGLWNADGSALLESAIVETFDTPYPSTSPDGVWRFRAIPRLVLPPGNYVVGAIVSDFDLLRNGLAPLSITTIPEVSYVEDRIKFTSSLEYPGGRLLVDGFGPNLLLANEVILPALAPAATAALVAMLGSVGAARIWSRSARCVT